MLSFIICCGYIILICKRTSGSLADDDSADLSLAAQEQPHELPNEQPNELPNELPNEQPNEQPNEHPNELPNEQPTEQPNEQPEEQVTGLPGVQSEEVLNIIKQELARAVCAELLPKLRSPTSSDSSSSASEEERIERGELATLDKETEKCSEGPFSKEKTESILDETSSEGTHASSLKVSQ